MPSATRSVGGREPDPASDLLSATRRAGIRSVFLTYGIGELGSEKPTKVFRSFKALTGFLMGRR
ncbi:MAG: hypothetical protein V1873_06015 [Verrucomicrobiota bacterium]